MNQENQKIESVNPEQTAGIEEKKNEASKVTAEELSRMVSRGVLQLARPIRASDKDITELRFDFSKLTGWEFAQALDRDTSGKTNAFRLTQTQAIELFAAAAEKNTPDVDAEDIRRRMGIEDAIKATQLATSFFSFTSRAANQRITN